MKVVTRIINKRLTKIWKEHEILNEFQFAGRPGVGTNEAIYRMMSVIEEAHDRGVRYFSIQIDQSKAFDCVPHWLLKYSLARLGVPEDAIDFMGRLNQGDSQVLTPFALTEEYRVECGVRQGGALSAWILAWPHSSPRSHSTHPQAKRNVCCR